jgi:hypothetical protein
VEHDGHTWSFSTAAERTSDQRLDLAAASVDRVGEVALRTHGMTLVDFRAGSWRATEGSGGGGGFGGFFAPAGARVHVSLTRGSGSYSLALYERAD